MTITNVETDNLGINILGHDEYDAIENKLTNELYVVKNTNADTDNSISSRTYADVGRYAVHYGPTAPTSEFARIWIDTSVDPELVEPASVNIDNLSDTGKRNVQELLCPDFSRAVQYSESEGESFTVASTGWLYAVLGAAAELELKKDDSSGFDLIGTVTTTNVKTIDHILLEKNTTVYVNRRSGGTIVLMFYPCKGSV